MISAVLIVLNEKQWIRQCLNNIRNYPVDEVIVVDGGSTDNTVQIIREEYPEVSLHERQMPFSFAEQRNFAKSLAQGDWILSLDADETLQGAELIPELINKHCVTGFSFPTLHLNAEKEDADPHIRLFQNLTNVQWEREIHEYLTLDGVPLVAHPCHMGDQKQIRWTPEVTLLHWAYMASEESLRAKARRYMQYNGVGAGIQINSEEDLLPK